MLSTTVDAVKAILKADPTLSPTDRARIVTAVRGHCREPEVAQRGMVERRIISRAQVARLFNCSLRSVDRLAQESILRKVKLPGRQRAIGFLSDEVDRVMSQ